MGKVLIRRSRFITSHCKMFASTKELKTPTTLQYSEVAVGLYYLFTTYMNIEYQKQNILANTLYARNYETTIN